MKYHQGYAFPDADEFMLNELQNGRYQYDNLNAALKYVKNWTCAIDGGAHVGTWSKVMSQRFEKVIAFEPSHDTYECLVRNMNLSGCTNVDCRHFALGSKTDRSVFMALTPEQLEKNNTGARFALDGGDIPVTKIDSLNLQSLGFLKLDVEGSEPDALRGGLETLLRCKPVVLFENKWLWTKHYGLPKDAVKDLLTSAGYRKAEQVVRDQIWVPR